VSASATSSLRAAAAQAASTGHRVTESWLLHDLMRISGEDIAERLYLSVRTVNNHLQHAYAKLGVSSRAGLARALGSGP